jgi:hypothetical protein
MLSSGSSESLPSKVQVRPAQVTVASAVGGAFDGGGGGVPPPVRTTLKLTPRVEVELAIAVRPPVLPVTLLLLSTVSPDMCPDPVWESVLRTVWEAGAVQPLVLVDLSAQ